MRTSVLPLTISVVLFATALANGISAEGAKPSSAQQLPASDVRIESEQNHGGRLYARIGGKDVRIADHAVAAWLLDNGHKIAYSGADGAGGYENEGQSLRIYEVQTGTHRKVLASYYVIDKVSEVKTRRGKQALLVEMRDGGLGASHLAVVDPRRGEVFMRKQVKLLGRQGDMIVVGYYHEADWERMDHDVAIQPYKTERYDINALLRRGVIQNSVLP